MLNEDNKKSVLRIVYFEDFEITIFDIIEEALNRANLNVEQFGGGSWFVNGKNEMIRGYTDFFINKYEDFDVEFCREVVASILPINFEIEVYEDDPFYNTFP